MIRSMVFKQRPPLLFTVGTAVVLTISGAIAWALTQHTRILQGAPAGLNIIPQDALVVVSLTTDSSEWRKLRQFGTPETQAKLDSSLVEWRDRLLTDNQLDFARDIQPWVGSEVTVTLLPSDLPETTQEQLPSDSTTGKTEPTPDATQPGDTSIEIQQPLAVILPIANLEQLQATLGAKAADTQWTLRTYRGVEIREQNRNGTSFAAAVIGNAYVVFSNDVKVLERIIDVQKGDRAITATPGVLQAFKPIAADNLFARSYVNLATVRQEIEAGRIPPATLIALRPLQDKQGLVMAATLESRGVRLHATSWVGTDSDRTFEVENKTDIMPARLPFTTLAMASGTNLQQIWQDYSQHYQGAALLPMNPNNLRVGIQAATGLSLDDDLMPWMAGAFTLGMVPDPSLPDAGKAPESEDAPSSKLPDPGLVILLQVSDRTAAEKSFDQLNQVMADRYRFEVKSVDFKGIAATEWVSPFQSLSVVYGWLDDNVLFLTLGRSVAELMVPKPQRSLAENPLFQTTTSSANRVNSGHFFIDFTRLRQAQTNNLFLPQLSNSNGQFIQAIQSIGLTTTVLDNRSVEYDIYVALEQGKRPTPLPAPPTSNPQPQDSLSTPSKAPEPDSQKNDDSSSTPTDESPSPTSATSDDSATENSTAGQESDSPPSDTPASPEDESSQP